MRGEKNRLNDLLLIDPMEIVSHPFLKLLSHIPSNVVQVYQLSPQNR
jgi:hypothetical protein